MVRLLPRFAGAVFFFAVASAIAAPQKVVFASYNLENYLLTARHGETGRAEVTPKSEASITALVRVIAAINPDILGVCEMGTRGDFDDFRRRLESAGLKFIDAEYVDGPDLDRHLALLSRFPIATRNSRPDIPFQLHGSMEKVRRGILDVTIAINDGYQLRLVGAHLKSKLPDPRGETLLRRCEAHLVRQHIETILRGNSDCNLLVYGDLNDTRNEPTIQEIIGPGGASDHLAELPLQDENGDRWTHYWRVADIYSRIDYIMVNRALAPEIVPGSARISRAPAWSEASDHRPVITAIRARDSRSKKMGAFSEN